MVQKVERVDFLLSLFWHPSFAVVERRTSTGNALLPVSDRVACVSKHSQNNNRRRPQTCASRSKATLESEAFEDILTDARKDERKGLLSSLRSPPVQRTLHDLFGQVEGFEEVQACGEQGLTQSDPARQRWVVLYKGSSCSRVQDWIRRVEPPQGSPTGRGLCAARTRRQKGYSILEDGGDSLRLLPAVHVS